MAVRVGRRVRDLFILSISVFLCCMRRSLEGCP